MKRSFVTYVTVRTLDLFVTPTMILVVGISLCSCSNEESEFDKMVRLKRYEDNRAAAYELARALRNKPAGIDAAIADLNVTGGRSQGLSSWMLITSSLTTNIEPRLATIAESSQEPMNRRVEALWVLWLRTTNLAYLEQLFMLVTPPGDMAVGYGRRYLQKSFVLEAERLRRALDVPERQPLLLTLEDFRKLIQQPGVVFRETKEMNSDVRRE